MTIDHNHDDVPYHWPSKNVRPCHVLAVFVPCTATLSSVNSNDVVSNKDWNRMVSSVECLHAWCTPLASYIWADTVSYHCNGLPLCPWLRPHLTSATSAAQCRFWPHVRCCVLLRGVSFWSLEPVWLLCSEGPFRLWVHQHGMISPLNCVPCWWPTHPNFTSLSSPSFLSVAGLGAPLSSCLLKRRYISLQTEWMNESLEPASSWHETNRWKAYRTV